MARLYLIRHARPSSAWGGEDGDPGLDEVGRQQAEAACWRLMALPEAERPVRVASSPLRRCRETAQPLARALGVAPQIDPAVGEIPTPSGLDAADRPAWLRKVLAGAWDLIEGDIDYLEWRRCVASALAAHDRAAVFSHYVAINAVVGLLTGEERVLAFRPDHASITILELEDGRLRLVSLGDEAATEVH